MPARVVAIYTAAAAFLGLKPKVKTGDLEGRIIKTINASHQSWVEKGWVKEKPSTRV